ncbi:platelet endothelial cell adhesion molecule-like isoform X3 [Scyliorhinus torazame]|uniref:platelet endothelial cell adhesion molecule-like isoform X3 n=1 Tax=Scyliorhinus torazame TaxID=75743 RepID=UPI003B5AB6B3
MLKIIVPFLTLLLIEMNKTETQKGVSINSAIIKSDTEENIREGSKITLTCSASILKQQMEALQIVYLFYKGEDKGVLLKNVTSDERETQCIIQSARVSHSGYYHCVVEAGSEKKDSEPTFITVKGKLQTPLLSIQPMNVTVGDSIVLRCASEEIPPLTFIFFKEKEGQKPQRLKDINSNNKSAVHQLKVIANTDKNYSCKVRVSGISDSSLRSKIVQITVQDPFSDPVLEIEPSDRIFEGDNLTIQCIVNFTPLFLGVQPEILIVKDATPITTNYNATTAVFTTTAALNDTGEYECMVKWKEAMKMTKRQVIVKVPVSEPTLKSTRTGDNAVEGDTLDLSCAVLKGSYPITYKFYKVTTDGALYQKTLNATKAVYSITSVNSEHHGTYSCEASNTVNQRNQTKRSQYVTITVKVPVSNPTIKQNSLKDVYKTGEAVTLLCHSTTGTLPITYSLFLNKRFIYSVSKSNTESAAFEVLINETKDGGEYKCKAENEIPNLFKYSEGMNFTVKDTTWWIYISSVSPVIILVAAAVILSLCLKRLRSNKDISQADESDGTHQGEPLQHIQGAYTDRNHEGDYTNIMPPEGNGADTERNHEGDYTYIMLPEENGYIFTGSDSESDCDRDYTNVSSKRKAANIDSDSCSDENDAIQYTQIDLTALQSGNMPQPQGHTVYASIAFDKIQQGSP